MKGIPFPYLLIENTQPKELERFGQFKLRKRLLKLWNANKLEKPRNLTWIAVNDGQYMLLPLPRVSSFQTNLYNLSANLVVVKPKPWSISSAFITKNDLNGTTNFEASADFSF